MDGKKTVLIVEDEKNIVDIIRFNLQREGYETQEAYDGEAGLSAARENNPDLILLDVMMPRMTGFEVCKALRGEGDNTPVIILTAREEEEDKILGLEIGADDYITKPFGVHELLARIAAVLRRSAPSVVAESSEDAFCGTVLSAKRYRLEKGEKYEPLTDIEMKLAQVFASHANTVLSRDSLLNAVWGVNYTGTTRTLDQHVANLRRKVERLGGDPSGLQTVHGIGYRYGKDPAF